LGGIMRRWGLLVLSVLSGGCATLFSGTTDEVTFTSEPSGARVLVDGDEIGATPLTYEVERQTFRRSEVVIQKPGYRSEKFPLKKTLNTVAILNCTSILSWGTDALTGAMMEYSPNKYFVELTRKGERADVGHRRALQFVLLMQKELVRQLARREGEQLRTLAFLFGANARQFPAFVAALEPELTRLIRYEHPHELYTALVAPLARAGFAPVDCGCDRFDNDGKIGSLVPTSLPPALEHTEPAFAAFIERALASGHS
jgi:hypothetical protein